MSKAVALRTLDLSNNDIDDTGIFAIADLLIANTTISDMNLAGNRIGCVGGAALGTCLIYNTSLRTLILDRNEIGDSGSWSYLWFWLSSNAMLRMVPAYVLTLVSCEDHVKGVEFM